MNDWTLFCNGCPAQIMLRAVGTDTELRVQLLFLAEILDWDLERHLCPRCRKEPA